MNQFKDVYTIDNAIYISEIKPRRLSLWEKEKEQRKKEI